MSTMAGGAFADVLRQVGQGLALPLRSRVKILRELAFDLDELSADLMARGVPAEEARRRAAEALVPHAEALTALDRIHAPLYQRVTRGVTAHRLRAAERGALFALTSGVVLVEGLALRRVPLSGDPSTWLAPVLAAGGLLFALTAAKAFALFVKGDHRHPARGLNAILAAAGVTLALGVAGGFFELYGLALALEARPELAGTLLVAWLGRTAVLLAVSLLLALAGGLAWFFIVQWISVAEGGQAEILGIHPHPPTRER
ncbi:MAG: hypothetical protein AMXMBFR53_30460 [Gemmatimonadota bacterium]